MLASISNNDIPQPSIAGSSIGNIRRLDRGLVPEKTFRLPFWYAARAYQFFDQGQRFIDVYAAGSATFYVSPRPAMVHQCTEGRLAPYDLEAWFEAGIRCPSTQVADTLIDGFPSWGTVRRRPYHLLLRRL